MYQTKSPDSQKWTSYYTHTLQYTAGKGEVTVREVHLWKDQGLKGKAVPATAEAITMHCVRPSDKIDQ